MVQTGKILGRVLLEQMTPYPLAIQGLRVQFLVLQHVVLTYLRAVTSQLPES